MISRCRCGIMIWVHLGCPICPDDVIDVEWSDEE